MPSRKRLLVLSAVVVAAFVVAVVVVVLRTPAAPSVTASSGTDPADLVGNEDRDVGWRTDEETVGAWVELAYPEPTAVDRVQLLGPGGGDTGATSALLTFDGGGELLVTTDDAGDASVDFPERTVSWVRVTVAGVPDGATSVALAGLTVDGSADDPPRRGSRGPVTAETSSEGSAPAAALSDGTPAEGDTGDEWTPADGDDRPWARLTWDTPREVASVQVFGPSSAGDDADVPLSGVLRFDDGSSVRVSAIASGGHEGTTIAFAPRMATAVRLELDAAAGLREFAVYDAGTTPPRWPQDGDTYAVSPQPAGTCEASSDPFVQPEPGRLTLVCPSPGSVVDGRTDVVVAADPGTAVEARVWTGGPATGTNAVDVVATAVSDGNGRALLTLDTAAAPRGPLTIRVDRASAIPDPATVGAGAPVYVQLYNRAGQDPATPDTAPEGMTLQWAEEFTGPLSVSATGAGADYAALKPDASSSGQFGDAPFADPASEAGTLTTVDDEYLRIRTQPIPSASSRDGTANVAGLLASTDVDGAGFAAQYGYFEARMLGAPGPGTWPAFWMLNTESAARPSRTAAEVDVVELYGHNTLGSCHTVHNWGAEDEVESDAGAPSCLDRNDFADWAVAWHTYGARITPDAVTFTIDGEVVATAGRLQLTSEPFFFLLNLALGGGWPVDLSATGGISDLYVDWVRVYS
ncbi:glycoside hydrolase family 16 protein [Geodermatophilus obscurus]|uniref:Glycoside hydrolase family 16 n=1 Tax=Geodermatophilus obscurus (strain ATCC 25078 / DSM 43160 / JCM 3152 / CCUG 61914 / KCC A-0152 / KCTC 9177 / NBRC 13315 / NRRL B-3577 / G-20) TaxID=526225 RepID=D2S567_GEOOG|nr:glycoside hydrolase family 16 protein [Geodermatophilus obscurus]ADB73178.1 glycoside hydrolase family 16 [Geodermatophilus obscurus DSM 43160]